MAPRNCQTSTAAPAEPGGLSLGLEAVLDSGLQLAHGLCGGDGAEGRAAGHRGAGRAPVYVIGCIKAFQSDQKRVRLPDMKGAAEVCIEVLISRSIEAFPGPVSHLPAL